MKWAWLLLGLFSAPLMALEAFEAHYRLLLDGEEKGRAHFSLRIDDRGYNFESFTQPKAAQGLQEVLERSQGTLTEGLPRPDSYYYAVKGADGTQMVEFFFDWPRQRFTLRDDDGTRHFRLEPHTQDRLSYLLRAMVMAERRESEARFPRLAPEGTEILHLHRKGKRHLTTGAGRFLAQEITMVTPDGKSLRRLWLAVHRHHLPLVLERHTDRGLARMELIRIDTP